MNEVFKIIGNCIPVKGFNRSVICDLHRNKYDFIPNDLYDIMVNHEGETIKNVKSFYQNEYDDIIEEYFHFLVGKEYIFFTDTPDWFPKMGLSFHYPFLISNAIIDVNENSSYDYLKVLYQLSELKCKFLEIRFYNEFNLSSLEKMVNYLDEIKSMITFISITIPYITEGLALNKFLRNHPRISHIYFYMSNRNEIIQDKENETVIIYSISNIKNNKSCGLVLSSYFTPNIKNFTESKKHNSCLNRKISIDVNGEIKNCPSMPQSFGNIKDTTLQEALNHKDFKKYWNITKDQIQVCKDCEFRYICTDCRAYKENPEDDYSKPLKCGYDPYTNKWEEWSTNPLKQKAIEYYGMQELVKKND